MRDSITPEDKLKIVGLFMVSDELTAQQNTVLRSIASVLKMSFEVESVKEGIDYGVFVCNGPAQDRVEEMLQSFEIEVKAPVIAPAGQNFYSLDTLERARTWLRKEFSDQGEGSETMETHYLTSDLMRIPGFNSWVHLLSYESAVNIYLKNEMLQFHKDDIIEAALNGGMSF